jgi:hypothetical protein
MLRLFGLGGEMPDFTLRPNLGITLDTWDDPATLVKASRIRPAVGIPFLNWIIAYDEVRVVCTPDGGSEGAADSELDGRPFLWWWLEAPGAPPTITTATGFSSTARFTPSAQGHYTLEAYRARGGFVIIHFTKL